MDMNNSIILKKILPKTKNFTLLFFIFKIVVIIFYLISNYQNLTPDSIKFLLKILLLTDSFLFFICIMNIFYFINLKTFFLYKIVILIFSIINAIWAIIDILSISIIIAFSN